MCPVNIRKSVSDLFKCTDEITSKLLAVHKKALAAELKNMGEHGKSLSLSGALSFPVPAIAHIGAYNLLVEEGHRTLHGQIAALLCEDCFRTQVHVALDVYVVEGACC